SAFPAGRSRGVTVAVEGFFAFVWFGWGQADAPSWLVIPLAVGTVLGALLAVAGVVVAKRSPGPATELVRPSVYRLTIHRNPVYRPARGHIAAARRRSIPARFTGPFGRPRHPDPVQPGRRRQARLCVHQGHRGVRRRAPGAGHAL